VSIVIGRSPRTRRRVSPTSGVVWVVVVGGGREGTSHLEDGWWWLESDVSRHVRAGAAVMSAGLCSNEGMLSERDGAYRNGLTSERDGAHRNGLTSEHYVRRRDRGAGITIRRENVKTRK
jgi:hypothetical protein